MDGNFYRGSATEQSSKFTDKEKKLLQQMKFEKALETEVDLKKTNINVIKPWITQKITSLLGMEDDVVCEYVFTQLEEKQLNPKIMQINLTGFLNARRAREFMGELWEILIEAQKSPDGIPMSLVEKKIEELKTSTDQKPDDAVAIDLKDTSSNWNNRYQSLTYGKYKPQFKDEDDDDEPSSSRNRDRHRDRRNRDRSDSPERRRRRDRSESTERRRRGRDRSVEREHRRERKERKRSRSPRRVRKRSRTPERRMSRSRTPEETERRRRRSRSDDDLEKRRHRSRSAEDSEKRKHRRRSRTPERKEKKKKEKKSRERRERSSS